MTLDFSAERVRIHPHHQTDLMEDCARWEVTARLVPPPRSHVIQGFMSRLKAPSPSLTVYHVSRASTVPVVRALKLQVCVKHTNCLPVPVYVVLKALLCVAYCVVSEAPTTYTPIRSQIRQQYSIRRFAETCGKCNDKYQ